MASVYEKTLDRISEEAGLSRQEVARVVGVSPRTIVRWAAGETRPRSVMRERLLDLAAIAQQLGRVMQGDAARTWLFEPNPLLNDLRPASFVAKGKSQDVLAAIEGMGGGVFV